MFAWVLTMFSNTRSLSSIAERSVQRTYGSGTTLPREKSHKPQRLLLSKEENTHIGRHNGNTLRHSLDNMSIQVMVGPPKVGEGTTTFVTRTSSKQQEEHQTFITRRRWKQAPRCFHRILREPGYKLDR
jgi:hypothetical protein